MQQKPSRRKTTMIQQATGAIELQGMGQGVRDTLGSIPRGEDLTVNSTS